MLLVTLYSRKDCHLCDDVKKELGSLQKEYPHRLAEVLAIRFQIVLPP